MKLLVCPIVFNFTQSENKNEMKCDFAFLQHQKNA